MTNGDRFCVQRAYRALDEHGFSAGSDELEYDTEVVIHDRPVTLFRRREDDTIGVVIPASDAEYSRFRPDLKSEAFSYTRLIKNQQFETRLSLLDPSHRGVFELLVDDVLKVLEQAPTEPIKKVGELLERWRQLFARRQESWLSKSEEVGLLCELEVLNELLERGLPMSSWWGPEGDYHDFQLENMSIECKATAATDSFQIEIHNAKQLYPTADIPLRLVVRKYRRAVGGPLNVLKLCQQIRASHAFETANFIAKLDKRNANPFRLSSTDALGSYYPEFVAEYDVEEGFPRLEIPELSRISSVRYSINLDSPEEIPGYLESGRILDNPQ